jgi:hypothetical protein
MLSKRVSYLLAIAHKAITMQHRCLTTVSLASVLDAAAALPRFFATLANIQTHRVSANIVFALLLLTTMVSTHSVRVRGYCLIYFFNIKINSPKFLHSLKGYPLPSLQFISITYYNNFTDTPG